MLEGRTQHNKQNTAVITGGSKIWSEEKAFSGHPDWASQVQD